MSKKNREAEQSLRELMMMVYSHRECSQAKRERDEARPKPGTGLDGYALMVPKRNKK